MLTQCSCQKVTLKTYDLSKAYDSVPHGLLIAKLEAYGLGKTSLHLLRDYLSD